MMQFTRYVFLFFILFLLTGCAILERNVELEKSISSITEDKNNSEISLTTMTSFDWEKAFLFTPYSTQEGIEEQLGVKFNDPSDIDYRDDIYLLVFINDNKVVQYVEVERHGADFTIGEKEYLTPLNDVIIIYRNL
ncbi:hypothetical protein [Paraliobacillus sp. JSM ZJ581]|uniref:hypothetical protein n=1 Tax=Paraliobacillus sp. JSM ZJ581 TaxID=3342118 RepID=UPI0035A887C0